MLRIGMLTSGGDCQALNAAMRGVYKAVTKNAKEPVEFYGFEDGHLALRCVSPVTLAENADGSATLSLGDLSFPLGAAILAKLQ